MPTPAGIALAEEYRLRQCPRKACIKETANKVGDFVDSLKAPKLFRCFCFIFKFYNDLHQ